MLKITAVFLLTVSSLSFCHAQDSTKTKPVVKPVTKAVPGKPAVVKYKTPGNYPPRPVIKAPATTTTVPAQPNPNAPTPVSTDKSLNGQYQYVLGKTYHYQQPMIAALWKNINDSLAVTKRTLKEVQIKLSAQNQSISSLQNDVKAKEQTIADNNARQNDISLFGIYLTKTTYNLLMWGLVIGLGLILLIVILRTTGNSREAKYRTKLYEELNDEFTAYKAKTNDKEKKLARELQTERNKNDELMGRG